MVGRLISAVLNERDKFRIRDGTVRQLKRVKINLVARALIVKSKLRTFVADFNQPAIVIEPA